MKPTSVSSTEIATLPTGRALQTPRWQAILKQIIALEKKTFPKSEAMDIAAEVAKRGIICWVVLLAAPPPPLTPLVDSDVTSSSAAGKRASTSMKEKKPLYNPSKPTSQSPAPPTLLAYAILTHSSTLTRLHKLCVHPAHRRQGLAESLLLHIFSYLDGGGGGGGEGRSMMMKEVDLWVDVEREGARRLYRKVGFREEEVVVGYYGVGRDGARMVRGG